jgi:nicotinamide mononucleotide (NMN) deamidase PncC
VKTKEYTFDGGRESIRKKAAEAALGLLWFEFGQLEI